MKRIQLVSLVLGILFFISGCGGGSASTSTMEGTAQTFVQAMINKDTKMMESINKSDPLMGMPTSVLISDDAKNYEGYKLEDFTFKPDENSHTVAVTSKDGKISTTLKIDKVDGQYAYLGYK